MTLAETRRNVEHKWLSLAVLAAGLSMIVLDGTIVGIALPAIIDSLHLDLVDAEWVNSLYSVVFAALLLGAGRVGDRWGRRRLFLAGTTIFVVGSLTAALSSGAAALIASRAIQGVGGALVLPATLSTVNATFRGKDRSVAFGIWGAVMAGMAAIGPLLGGWLATFDWRWIFLVNLPVGLAVIIGTFLVVPETKAESDARGWDVVGTVLSAAGFALIVFGLIEGVRLGWWQPETELNLFGFTWPSTSISAAPVAIVGGVVVVAAFLAWERFRTNSGRTALLDLRLFSLPTFSWGNLTAAMVAVGEFALVFVLPLYLINALGLEIMAAGWVLAAMALGALVSGSSARLLAGRLGAANTVVLGLGLELVGAAVTAFVVARQLPDVLVAAPLVVYGIGLGLASAQLTSTILADVPTDRSGTGSATQSTARQLGSALGAALAGTTLAARLSVELPAQLANVAHLPADLAARLASATETSAGGAIASIRIDPQLGALGPQVADALATGFAAATATAIAAATVFIALGLVGSLRVARVAAREDLHTSAAKTS